MPSETLDEILDDLFLGCALVAFVESAIAARGLPEQEATRILAYRYYEEALAEKNAEPRAAES